MKKRIASLLLACVLTLGLLPMEVLARETDTAVVFDGRQTLLTAEGRFPRVGELLELQGKKDVRLIVNRVDREMLSTVRTTIDDVMDNAGLPLAGIVPEDPCVTLAASFGKPLLQYSPRCPAAKACRRIARRIQGFHEPITLR